MRNSVIGIAINVATLALCPTVSAFSSYQSKFPNGKNVKRNGVSWPGVGHKTQYGGGARNPFGVAFAAAGHSWTKALCEADSDGDGQSNGLELGDPSCEWKEDPGVDPKVSDVSHPGFADSKVVEVWSEDRLLAAADSADLANTCYFAIFPGDKCVGGGVYKISPDWYANHGGGRFAAINGCGNIITNWLGRSGSHGQYEAKVDASEDLAAGRATFVAPFDCSDPIEATTTQEPTTTQAPTAQKSTFDVEATCSNAAKVAVINLPASSGQLFCAELVPGVGYKFYFLIKPDTNTWAAVGFNTVFKMAGTEVMWLGIESGTPQLRYKKANGYGQPKNIEVEGSEPQDLTVEKVEKGLQATWTRPFEQKGLMTLTADTSSLTIINVYKAGALSAAFSRHDEKASYSANLAEVGLSAVGAKSFVATGGNLAHGALMILAWICLSPCATFWMKYGKHLNSTVWFKGHVYTQSAAIIVTVISIIIIAASGVKFGELSEASYTHACYGFAVLGLCIFQGILGATRNKISGEKDGHDVGFSDSASDFPHGPNRWIFNLMHRANGWALFVLGAVTVHKGIMVFNDQITDTSPKQWLQDPAPTVFLVWAIVAGVMVIIMELAHLSSYDLSSGGPFSCSGKDSVNKTFAAKADSEMKLRSVLISLFTAFSIATTVALWVIIGDTEKSDGFAKPE